MGRLPQPLKFFFDLLVSAVLWIYFTVGFVLFFIPQYLLGSRHRARREGRTTPA